MVLDYRIRVYYGDFTWNTKTWGTLTECKVSEGSLSLEKILVEKEVHFGACFSSKFQCQVYDITADLSGKWVKVVKEANSVQTVIFEGKIDKCTKDYSGTYRDIEAYDFMYYWRSTNIADIWNALWTPEGEVVVSLPLAQNRGSGETLVTNLLTAVCSYSGIGITISNQSSLVNKAVEIPKSGVKAYSRLTLEAFLHAVGEMNGIIWQTEGTHTLTAVNIADTTATIYDLTNNIQGVNSSFEDYQTYYITHLQVYEGADNIKASKEIRAGNNPYPMSNNFLMLALDVEDLTETNGVLDKIASVMGNLKYTPFSIKTCYPDWTNVVLGKRVQMSIVRNYSTNPIQTETIYGVILSLKMSGIQLIDVTAECKSNGERITQTSNSSDDGLTVRGDFEELEEKIDQEILDRQAADAAEATARQNAISAEEQARQVADANEVTERTNAISNATKLITGATGGYVFITQDTNTKKPIEICIADSDGVDEYGHPTADNVWRWNKNGLGFSYEGYSGDYDTAITKDGQIVANFVSTGTLNASLIKTGKIKSFNDTFEFDMDTGDISMISIWSTDVSTAKSEAISTAATDATNKVNAVQVGGKNLIINSATAGALSYGNLNFPSTGASGSSTDVPSNNYYALTYTGDTSSSNKGPYLTVANYDGKIKNGDKFAFSVWLKASVNRQITITAEFGASASTTANLTTSWQKFEVIGVANKDVTGTSQVAITFYSTEYQNNDVLYISSPMLEIATKCSNWCPAPEDNATASEVSSLNARETQHYTETTNNINAQITSLSNTTQTNIETLRNDTNNSINDVKVSYVSQAQYDSYSTARDAAAQALIDAAVNPIKQDLEQCFNFSRTDGLTIKGYDSGELSKIDLNLKNDKFAIRYQGVDQTWMDDDEFHVKKLYGENYSELCGLKITKTGNHVVIN